MLGPGFPPSQRGAQVPGAAPGKPHITHISSEVHCCRAVVLRVRWWVGIGVGMVVRFVCVIRVPVCARVAPVCPVCVPAPHGIFLPVPRSRCFLPDFPTTVVGFCKGLLGLDGCVRY